MITTANFSKLIEALLPPDRRTPIIVDWNVANVDEVQLLSDNLFNTYKKGILSPVWTSGTYSINDTVKYGTVIYQSAIDLNTDIPAQTENWVVIADNFIGTDQRIKFTGEKLTLEYALNEWFGSFFRQPPLTSDIFITTNETIDTPFLIGNDEQESSIVYIDTSSEFVVAEYTSNQIFYNMSIFVPSVVMASLATNLADQISVIRHFSDKYINAGITYDIVVY